MGCSINEIVVHGDSVTVHTEGEFITYVLSGGNRLKYTAFSKNYFSLFRFRPSCQMEHETAAMEALSKRTIQETSKIKRKGRRKKKKKEKIDPYQFFKNPYPIDPFSFPVGEDGEYIGHSATHIANYVSALFRNEKRNGVAKPDFKEITDRAFGELRFVGKNLSAVRSALSKEIWRRRKAKAAEITRRKIEEARQAEFAHMLPLEN